MDLEPDTESASSLMCCSWPGRTSARSGATPRDSSWPASERWTVSCWRWLPTSLHLQHHRGRPDHQGHHEALQDQGGVWQAGVVYKKTEPPPPSRGGDCPTSTKNTTRKVLDFQWRTFVFGDKILLLSWLSSFVRVAHASHLSKELIWLSWIQLRQEKEGMLWSDWIFHFRRVDMFISIKSRCK